MCRRSRSSRGAARSAWRGRSPRGPAAWPRCGRGPLAAIPFRVHLIEIQKLAFPTARAAGEVIRKLFVDRRTGIGWLVAAALRGAAGTGARDGYHLIGGGGG